MGNENLRLQVACKTCGGQIIASVQMEPAKFAVIKMGRHRYTCPSCHQSAVYSYDDHFFGGFDVAGSIPHRRT